MTCDDPLPPVDWATRSASIVLANSDADQSVATTIDAGQELLDWLDSPPGRYLLNWEQARFDERVVDIFGFHAVQLGMTKLNCLNTNRMPSTLYVVESAQMAREHSPQPGLISRFEELPFASQSVDLIVLPHALELSADPHQLLREVERVLVPEGKLVVTCFNPYSLWGLRQLIGRIVGMPYLPRAGQFISLPRLRDWLKLLNFEVEGGQFGCYRPALRSERWLSRTALMEKAGDRWWPVLGAVYMLVAVKRVRGMRLIGPAWKTRSQRAASLAPAAQRDTTYSTKR